MHEPIGFMARAPLSEWNKRIGVDYPGVFKAVLKATVAVATANAPGAISAAIDGFFAFKLEDAQRTPEELAWLLTRRALAHAMAELTVEAARRHGTPLQDKEGLVTALDQALDGTEIWIDPAFFDRPAGHAILEAVKPEFQKWLLSLGLKSSEAKSVSGRLGAYFTFALRREWAEHIETYRPLEAELQRHENRFAQAGARERAWIRNADYLQRLIREPVFDEAFGLEQIYVPLRAWYQEVPATSSRRGQKPDQDTDEKPRRIVIDLERQLSEWLEKADKKDSFRVVCGGPGSGKTSSTKVWAAKLARDGHHVLYVPLHRLDIRSDAPDVQAMLWEYLSDLGVLPHDPLDPKGGETRLLLLFDGLDELAMQGRAGQEVARSFIDAVGNKIDRINEHEGHFVQVVFGGRDIVVEFARVPERRVLHVLAYHGSDPEQFHDPEKLLENETYACGRWWRQFGEATGEGYEAVPRPLQKDELVEITAQPLLNYLLALSYRRGELDFSTAPNLNLIFEDLLNAVYERPWGPAAHPTTKPLSREEFDHLLDELGLAAWHGAGRTFSEHQVEQACRQAGLEEALTAFKEGARAGAISLLAAFYFRQAQKIEGERTFEFTHKSFGEYLAARRIARWMEDIHEERVRNRSNRRRGLSVEDALVRWIEITGPTALDYDLLAFLKREVSLRLTPEVAEEWRKTFAELFGDQLNHGLPLHRQQLPTFQEMARQARNAEEALLAAHYCSASAARTRSTIQWPDQSAIRDLLGRLDQSSGFAGVGRSCLGWLDASNQDLYWAMLNGADLEMAVLKGARFFHANCARAILVGADLEGANLRSAVFLSADLRGASFRNAQLFRATLDGANFEGVDLEGADLGSASLIKVEGLDKARGLRKIRTLYDAKIERKWVERLGLDAKTLGLEVIEDRRSGVD